MPWACLTRSALRLPANDSAGPHWAFVEPFDFRWLTTTVTFLSPPTGVNAWTAGGRSNRSSPSAAGPRG